MGQRGTPVAKRNQNLRHAYVFDISSHCRFSSRQRLVGLQERADPFRAVVRYYV